MTIQRVSNTKYDLQTFSGDSGSVTIGNIPTDSQNYVIYFEINGNTKITKSIELHGESTCTFDFTANDTASLGVGTFTYGVKLCDSVAETENTCIPDLAVGSQANFIVFKERAGGISNA